MMRTRIGMLTPSSNTVLEPFSTRMMEAVPDATVHFSRFVVTEIALDQRALAQFDTAPMLHAAELLAHAHVDVIAWNGTSAGWLGLDADRELVAAIGERTGIRASTCVLSLVEALNALKVDTYGMVTPYTSNVQDRIVANFRGVGLSCGAERHFGIRDNYSFGTVEPAQIEDAARQVAEQGVGAVVIFCTNLAGADVAAEIENSTGVPVIDSVAVTVWGALRAAGRDTAPLAPWGPALAALQ